MWPPGYFAASSGVISQECFIVRCLKYSVINLAAALAMYICFFHLLSFYIFITKISTNYHHRLNFFKLSLLLMSSPSVEEGFPSRFTAFFTSSTVPNGRMYCLSISPQKVIFPAYNSSGFSISMQNNCELTTSIPISIRSGYICSILPSELFKKYLGISPGEYRKNILAKPVIFLDQIYFEN